MVDGIQELVEVLQPNTYEPSKTYSAEVSKVDNEGTVWVYLEGSNKETPTATTSAEVNIGDSVNVEWRNNKLYIAGNVSNPSVGVVRVANVEQATQIANQAAQNAVADAGIARQAAEQASEEAVRAHESADDAQASADSAQRSANSASEYASRALGNLSTVQSITETLTWITQHGTMALTTDTAIDPTHVYFVVDANGDYVVNSTHYAIVTEPDVADLSTYYELSIDESLNNYVGTHLALTSEGLWLLPASSGTNKVLIATGAGSAYTTAGTYIIDGNNTVLASFTANGATVGKANGAHTTVDANGMRIFSRSGVLVMADIGYGAGTSQSGTTEDAPYYTLGNRSVNSTIGNYSVAEGRQTTASGYCSHAEGSITTASGDIAHAEGGYTTASGGFSHAEGIRTTASGAHAHAEGNETTASGWHSHAEGSETTASGGSAHAEGENTVAEGLYSHAGGNYTIANARSQTVIGEYNEADTTSSAGLRGTYALIIGNGTADDARSNAFTVDWQGNVVASGDITDENGNTLTGIAQALQTVDSLTYTSPYVTRISVKRWLKVVTITLVNMISVPAGQNITLFTLPEGWRPPDATMELLRQPADVSTALMRVTVNADGTVQVYNYGTGASEASSNASCTITYITTQ